MPFIQLCDIGKIYAGESSVAVGIRSVNLSFEKGEFVAITGQSGSGKSTLLNVISGMDTYEEGEMLVEGEPTSHYIQQDYEEYRKKYISFIFQDYNIIESFTVLQNVELALMHIENKKERRKKALELLHRVGMDKHLRHRGSQLSGGQKQRTVIARALAKDSPVILADEPTGNLDSKTSREILELLHEVSKDKLLIVVTHNFEDVEPYATRHIRVFDGKIEFDRTLKPVSAVTDSKQSAPSLPCPPSPLLSNLKNGLELGRVRFFSMPKLSTFISILLIFSCLAITLITALYGESLSDLNDKHYMFAHINGRLVITRDSDASFTDAELEELMKKSGAVSYERCDYLTDQSRNGFIYTYKDQGKPDLGRYPEKAGEVLLYLPLHMARNYGSDRILKSSQKFFDCVEYDVVGIKYFVDNTKQSVAVFSREGYKIAEAIALYQNTITTHSRLSVSNALNTKSLEISQNEIYFSFDLESDEFFVYSKEFDLIKQDFEKQTASDGSAIPYLLKYSLSSSYYQTSYDAFYGADIPVEGAQPIVFEESLDNLTLASEKKMEFFSAQMYSNGVSEAICLNPSLIGAYIQKNFIDTHYNQASLYFDSDRKAEKACELLKEEGYTAVPSSTVVKADAEEELLRDILALISVGTWFIAIVFISLFMYLCTSKSMQATSSDIAILRTMGIPVKVIKVSIYVQTFIAIIPAFIFTALGAYFIYTTPLTNGIFTFLHAPHYVIIALGLVFTVLILSRRYVKKIFGTTVKKTLKGGGLK